MIMNVLDPRVAQFPHELVTYGGNGQVFSNWAKVSQVKHKINSHNSQLQRQKQIYNDGCAHCIHLSHLRVIDYLELKFIPYIDLFMKVIMLVDILFLD